MPSADATPLDRSLFVALADGQYHSGADLAARHGVTRGGVWKAIEHLRERGLAVEAQPNRGYRLPAPLAPLSASAILGFLEPELRTRVADCSVLWEAGSTNSLLLDAQAARTGQVRVLLAENQTAGRGRRGRTWQASLGGTLCLSLGFGVEALPRDFGGLTLAIGLAVLEAAAAAGARGLGIKWPNDLVHGPRKVAGILTELRAEAGGPAWVVCGIGINISLPEATRRQLAAQGAPATDLASLGLREDRNRFAARVIAQSLRAIDAFLANGLAPFVEPWRAHDVLHGRELTVQSAGRHIEGRGLGIDAGGALRVATAAGDISVIAGDVSVRARPEASQ